MKQQLKAIPVTCLVLEDADGFLFAAQRPNGKELALKWELPGGKMEGLEVAEEALRREIKEELSLELGDLTPLPIVEHAYSFGVVQLFPFRAIMNPRPAYQLNEHQDAVWIRLQDWNQLDWAPADIPIIRALLDKT